MIGIPKELIDSLGMMRESMSVMAQMRNELVAVRKLLERTNELLDMQANGPR